MFLVAEDSFIFIWRSIIPVSYTHLNNCPCSYPLYDDFRFEPIKENKEDADDDVRDQLYFGVQCGHPYGSDYMYEIFTGRNGYDIEFKCKNKKEVLQVIDQLAKDFEKEKHQ